MAKPVSENLIQYAASHQLEGLTEPTLHALVRSEPGYTLEKAKRCLAFRKRIERELLRHPVIVDNHYCKWFEKGEMSQDQISAFIVQFSVFSNLFLIAQLQKTINADSLDGMRASKEILANEIGVIFRSNRDVAQQHPTDIDREGDPELVSTEGTVENGTFRFRAAHFEWLLRIAEKLDLGFNDIGKRHHGTKSTLFFCDELVRLYANEDYLISQAASFAVENWAAAGFWNQLVTGFTHYNARSGAQLPLAFFTWHARIEAQHAAHTQEELEEMYFAREINESDFIRYGNEMLNGVATFWDGLEMQRKRIVT